MVIQLQTWWKHLKKWPAGRWIYSKILGFKVPYTGSVSPLVLEVRPGYARVCILDKKCVRNHLNCIHALALANVGELTTGLAVHFSLSDGDRAILTSISVEYLKKARGLITAEANIPDSTVLAGPTVVTANLTDSQGNLVTKVHAQWLIQRRNGAK